MEVHQAWYMYLHTLWKFVQCNVSTLYGVVFLVFFNTLWLCLAWLPDTLWVCSVRILDTMGACLMTFWTFNGSVFGVNFFTFGHCMRVWDDFWTLYGTVFKETFGQPIRVHSVWILDFWTLNGGVFSVTSGLTSASLQLLMNLSIWDSREFSKTSLCSSCPFRQVRIRQRKGWWLKRDLLQEKRWIQNIYVSKGV